MAEPAKKHPEIQPEIRPKLGVIQGGGESTPERGNLSRANNPAPKLDEAERSLGVIQGGGESTPERADLSSVDPSANIDGALEKETSAEGQSTGQQGFYNPSSEEVERPIVTKLVGLVKKKGPLSVILGGAGLIGFLMSTFLSPALLLVHIKNVFLNDLSDATPALTIRTDHMMRNMIKSNVSVRAGFCSSKVTVRCKFSTMSGRMERKFKKAGFTVEGDKKFGRKVISSIRYSTNDGVLHTLKTPQDMKNFSRTTEGRAALFKAFNPKSESFINSKFTKMLTTKFSKTKKSVVSGKDKKSVQESFDKSTGADKAAPASEGGRFKDAVGKSRSLATMTSSGVLLVAALGLACPLYSTAHAITYGIKAAKYMAFAQFAYTFLNETDKLVAGDADPEVISGLGDQLTSLTNNKKINDSGDGANEIDNPDYGKASTDSQGYRLSAYGDTGSPNASTARFSLGMATVGIMGSIAAFLTLPDKIPGGKSALKAFCKIMGNLVVGTLGIIAACVLAGGGALCVTINIIITALISLAVSKGINELVDYLIKQYGPMRLDSETGGTDVGNGYSVGSSIVFGGMAQANGMMPSKKEDLQQYFAYTDGIRKDTIAAETYDAKSEPFNIYNQYSFAGSIAQPLSASFMSQPSLAGQFSALLSTVTGSFGSLGKVSAAYNMQAHPYEAKRYSMCDDNWLNAANVDPDMLCTVRYSMNPAELEMDTDDNVVYMTTQPSKEYPYVDPYTGEANPDAAFYDPVTKVKTPDDTYLKFVRYCGVDRTEMIGSASETDPFDDDPWHTGKTCSDKNDKMSNFRVYTMNDYISAGFEEEPATEVLSTEGGTTFRAATFNILGSSHTDTFEGRANKSIRVIEDNKLEVIGFQEFQVEQRRYIFDRIGTTFNIFPKEAAKQPNPIAWDVNRFDFVDGGMMPDLEYFGDTVLQAPWVILKDKTTLQQFYVLNTHDPAHPENKGKRYRNALDHVNFIKSIQSKGLPVIFTGDFNSGYELRHGTGNDTLDDDPQKLAYCVLGKDGLMGDVYDLSEKRSFKCPNPGNDNAVDHIFVSDGVQADNYLKVGNNGSDHETHMADIIISGSGTGGQFNMGSFNICYGHASVESDPDGYASCSGNVNNYKSRLQRSVATIKDSDMGVVGLQEVRQEQWTDIQPMLPDYDIYPKPYGGAYANQNPIMWKKDDFTLVKGASVPGYTVTSGKDANANTLVKLRYTTTGQEFYHLNVHEPVSDARASQRTNSAKDMADTVKRLSSEGLPIFITGDFNSNYQATGTKADLPYCILTNNTGLWDAWDATKKRSGMCPSADLADKPRGVDHIYMSTSVGVSKYKYFGAGVNSNGSDHNTLLAGVVLPGGDSDSKKSTNITKVLVIPEENHSLDQMKDNMPYAFSQAKKYGYATNYTAITHPSLPNYIAIAGGSTLDVTDDALPNAHKLAGQSIFGQAISNGKTAKVYAESMKGTCATGNSGNYVARHNPWTYFVDEKGICEQFNVPLANFNGDVSAGKLPNVGMLIPNNCNNAHDCSLATADGWFKARMSTIFNGPDWKSGNLLVVLTADEDDKKSGNKVLTVLMNPAVKSKVVNTNLNHYSLSRLYSEVIGQAGLRNAKDAPSLLSSFGL